jgi:hypothetical protein
MRGLVTLRRAAVRRAAARWRAERGSFRVASAIIGGRDEKALAPVCVAPFGRERGLRRRRRSRAALHGRAIPRPFRNPASQQLSQHPERMVGAGAGLLAETRAQCAEPHVVAHSLVQLLGLQARRHAAGRSGKMASKSPVARRSAARISGPRTVGGSALRKNARGATSARTMAS